MHQTTLERIEQELKKIKRQLQCGTQFFDTVEEFPAVGVPCAIYVDKSTGAFYVYDTETATYITADAGEDIDFSLSTTGTSGPATLVGTILNIPQYQAVLTFDNTPTNGSTNPVTSDGIFDALALKQNNVTLTTTGTSGAATFVGSTLNIPQYQGVLTNPVTGTGTAGQVAYFNGTSAVTGSSSLFWDAANGRLGIGLNTGLTARAHVRGSGTTSATTALLVQNSTPTELFKVTDDGQTTLSPTANTSALVSSTYNVTGSNTTPLINLSGTWNTTGIANAIFVNITDTASSSASNLMNLQINSSSIFRVTKSIAGFAGGPIAPNGYGLGTGAQAIFSCNSSNAVINSAGSAINFSDNESSNSGYSYHFLSQQYVNKIYTSGIGGFVTISRGYAPTSGTGVFNALNIQNTINQTGGANGITRGLYVNPTLTAAADWRSVEFSNNTGWGLYGAGTANNYLGGSLGIGTTSLSNSGLAIQRNITGTTSVISVNNTSVVQSDVTSVARYFATNASTQAATFNLGILIHYSAGQLTFGLNSTVTSQYGYFVSSGLTGATNNFAFRGELASAANNWNLYMSGTAANYLAGNTSIGTTTSSGRLTVQGSGTTNATTALLVQNSTPSELFKVTDDGVVLLNFLSRLNSTLQLYGQSGAVTGILLRSISSSETATSGTRLHVRVNESFAPTSGTCVLNTLQVDPVINQTGGANGITRGLYVNPTLTAAADWRGVEITTSTVNTVVLGKNTGSAAVEVTSTTQGFLPPRMTTAQRNLIASPAAGLVIFNTTTTKLECYDGAAWQAAW